MDWLAACLDILAKILVGKKSRWGYIVHIASCFVWMYIGFALEVYGLVLITTISLCVNIWAFVKWTINSKSLTNPHSYYHQNRSNSSTGSHGK